MQTFGTVPSTYPPGVVFNLGAWVHKETQIVPICFLHFEQNRIVIDVAGPTDAIDSIADRLFHFLSGLLAADGTPVAGEPERVLEYSEITAQFSYPLDAIFARPFRKVLSKTMGLEGGEKSMTMIPLVSIQAFPSDEVLPAVPGANDPRAFTFTLRSGSRPEEHIYFSGAPLRSEAHIAYLDELATSLKS